ncbi:hypothetical protein MKZ38_000682 [Zalerion maritima]|uniref:Ubiquitin-like domain-containing protein n=1 Tax=Zalerion maritima TaxID=339359 RepID=A0AAD5RZ47_9PEZI|nr:hypothetical protein MKZ38_000682 [Zalerion maritima]
MAAAAKRPELQFGQDFIAKLDAAKVTRQADYVKDPRTYYKGQVPTLLPTVQNINPPTKPSTSSSADPTTSSAPSSSSSSSSSSGPSTTVTLSALKPPKATHSLPSLPLSTTSILHLKSKLGPLLSTPQTRVPASGIRILYKRKPVSDAKVLSEVVGEEGVGKAAAEGLEMSFMVTKEEPVVAAEARDDGEPAVEVPDVEMEDSAAAAAAATSTTTTTSLKSALTNGFWGDLQEFLLQRLKDEGQAKEALAVFREAVEKR